MEVINRNRKGNDGGIRQLYIAPASDYPAIMLASYHSANIPTIILNTYFTRISLIPETSFHSEEAQEDPQQGDFFRQEVHFALFRDSPDRTTFIQKWLQTPAIIYLVDANFVKKLIGTDTHPLKLSGKYDSGKAVQETNAYIYQFAGSTIQPALRADL